MWRIFLLATTAAAIQLKIKTRTGTFVGGIDEQYADVRTFKWIPYAKPPIGDKRWTPPERLPKSSAVYDSTAYGPSCSQYVSRVPSVWALNITGNLIVNYGQGLLSGQVAQNSAEDCLSLAIWTPAEAAADSKLPVMIFTTGGGDVTGGINIPTQIPSNWVHRSQKHIVVTLNYRVNIFSYPNARGLNNTNFSIQDQRAAVEWVSENIRAFGGDPKRMTLWGQSAGAGLTDQYLFAWPRNPIVRASVSSSGVAIGRNQNADFSGSNFTFVAKAMGCDFEDAQLEVQCMRRVPVARLENFIGQYQDNSTLVNASQPAIAFTRRPDNKFIFNTTQYIEKTRSGNIAKIPKMIGTTAREASALVPFPINNYTAGPSEQRIYTQTLGTVCNAYNTSFYREQAGLTTYRYEWAGNFSNVNGGVPWLGAYHYSDLYFFFGTYGIAPGEVPDFERATSERMQDLLYDFVLNPGSLPGSGWPAYNASTPDDSQIARFGTAGQTFQLVDGVDIDGACYDPSITYDTTP
ncbi:carboxylesterase [Elsinoe ampelina]|uniref:Carboxylic ester hydrolase n=1 Tax=Elsinoe ampelina TaxID=302913 RepID=A0A6A6GK37_9PEZI|nr:carboxylesterase [Elsinoe ampelina]